jgi:hypothetical protein
MDEQYRVTYLRANGSVWLQKYDSLEAVLEEMEFLVKNYPHVIISKTPFKLASVPVSDDRNIDDYLGYSSA